MMRSSGASGLDYETGGSRFTEGATRQKEPIGFPQGYHATGGDPPAPAGLTLRYAQGIGLADKLAPGIMRSPQRKSPAQGRAPDVSLRLRP